MAVISSDNFLLPKLLSSSLLFCNEKNMGELADDTADVQTLRAFGNYIGFSHIAATL